MSWLINSLLVGITSFVATNIDDIVILTLFFSQRNATFRTRHIVLGQYLGFIVLILASLPGFFGGLIIPKSWIGLLGFLPIAIGIRQLFPSSAQENAVQMVTSETESFPLNRSFKSLLVSFLAPPTYHVAAVTVANGGDNIGIYVPLFASLHAAGLMITLGVFFILIGVWCAIADYLARHPALAPILSRYGQAIVPYVLIGLGLFILIENGTYRLLPIA